MAADPTATTADVAAELHCAALGHRLTGWHGAADTQGMPPLHAEAARQKPLCPRTPCMPHFRRGSQIISEHDATKLSCKDSVEIMGGSSEAHCALSPVTQTASDEHAEPILLIIR